MSRILPYIKKNKLNILLAMIFILSPLILVTFAYQYANVDFSSFSPRWSDEIAHYRLSKDIVEYGEPLGHYGYNGSHAVIGDCIWTPLREWGLSLFGLCWGIELYSPLIANILFLCFANLIFALLAKPSNKQLVMLAIFNLTSYCYLYFSSTCMSECYFYAFSIVICGILYRLHKYPTGVFFRYFFAPLFILFAAFTCVPYGIFMFAYGWIIFKNQSSVKNFFLSACVTIISVAPAYVFSTFTDAPFPMNWSIPFSSEHFAAIRQFLFEQSVHIPKLHTRVFTFSCIVFLLLSIFCFIVFLRMIKKKDARLPEMFCIALLLYGFFVALLIMYPVESLWRSLLIMLIFTIHALILILPEKKTLCVLICIAVIGSFIGFHDCKKNIISHNVKHNYVLSHADEEKMLYEKWIQIDPSQSKWQNTVITLNANSLFLPIGTGVNSILEQSEYIPPEAGYALIDVNASEYNDICILLTKAGFVEVHKDDVRAIYVNSRYQ